AWLGRLAADLGVAAAGGAGDAAALDRLWGELEHWGVVDAALHGARPRGRKEFHRALWSLTSEAGLARTPRGPGRVRVLSADLARGLPAEYVFVMGLGERSFPRLTAPDLALDEPERLPLARAGPRRAG